MLDHFSGTSLAAARPIGKVCFGRSPVIKRILNLAEAPRPPLASRGVKGHGDLRNCVVHVGTEIVSGAPQSKGQAPPQAKPLITRNICARGVAKLLRPLLNLKIAIPRAKAGGTDSAMGGRAATPKSGAVGKNSTAVGLSFPPQPLSRAGYATLTEGCHCPLAALRKPNVGANLRTASTTCERDI